MRVGGARNEAAVNGTSSTDRSPAWEPWKPRAFPTVLLFPGLSPVATPDAIRRYLQWREANPHAAREFLDASNRRVMEFLRADAASSALSALAAYKRVSVDLGDAIGVSARITAPEGLDPEWCKSLGAGNELGVCLVPPGAGPPQLPAGVLPAELSVRGVLWGD